MSLDLTPDQTALFDMARDFARAEIAPNARAWEAAGTFPRDLWTQMALLGFGGLYVPEGLGGTGLSRQDAVLIFEALAMACPATSAFLSIHNMCAKMIATHGSADQHATYLTPALSMDVILSYCLTEPGSGSDAAALKSNAVQDGTDWILNGTKAFISGAGYSDAYIVMARTDGPGPRGISTFIVPKDAPGLSFGALEDKMGWRAQPTRQVQFDDVRLPSNALLGERGKGFSYAMAGLDGGRLNISACSLGGAQAAFDATKTYMAERHAFGQSIDNFQALQFKLADMATALAAARIFLRQAADKLDQGAPDATMFCAMAKAHVTEMGSRVVDTCLQLHGGYGYLADYGIEKLHRDLRVHQILEGTNDIMRLITARAVLTK